MLLESDLRLEIAPLLAITLLAGGCDRQSPPAPQAKEATTTPAKPETSGTVDMAERGSAMPDTVFLAPDGGKVTLADFKGKPLLVNLWATWCGPCVAEMPTLDDLAKREGARLQVIVVSQDDVANKPKIAKIWEERKFERLAPYIDSKSDLGFAFGTGMVPTTVLYDAAGKEVWRVIGAMNWDGPRANTLLSETLAAGG
jgi:thiol-disulfide isomerase/thioredoxin